MAILSPKRVESALWLLAYASLAVAVGVESDWGRTWQWPLPDTSVASQPPAKPDLTEPYKLPPADTFLETAMRPVFVVSRQPPPPPPAVVPVQLMKKGQFVLTGVTIVPSGKFAFLVEKAGNKNRTVTEGQDINGIKVKEITTETVVLSQYNDSEVLTLRASRGPAATVGPEPPPAQGAAVPPGGDAQAQPGGAKPVRRQNSAARPPAAEPNNQPPDQ